MNRQSAINLVVLLAIILFSGQSSMGQRPISSRGNERLIREIRHELVTLPFYSVFDNLEYKVDGDAVTLMGQVTRSTLKSDAGKAAQQIEGVSKVANQIEVLPVSPADDQIRRAVYYTLFSQNSSLFRYGWGAVPPIHIIVKGGRVTLVGVIDNASDKDAAALLVKGVSRIFSVTNNLRVEN